MIEEKQDETYYDGTPALFVGLAITIIMFFGLLALALISEV